MIIKELIKHENKFNRKVFQDRENSENRFQNFHISWKPSESTSRTFIGSLHYETNVKYVFHEISQCILAYMQRQTEIGKKSTTC